MVQSLHSFREARIGLLGCNEQDFMALTRQLGRLGALSLRVDAIDDRHLEGPEKLEALFVEGEADLGQDILPADCGKHIAIIALVGSEAPSQLNRILRHTISAHLMKPVRSMGILTALCVAGQTFRTHSKLTGEIEKLSERLKRRRFVFSAQLRLMNELGISEAAAFTKLRDAAMERRVTIEDISVELLTESSRILTTE